MKNSNSIINESISTWIENLSGIAPATQNKIIASIIIILVIWVIKKLTLRFVWKKTDQAIIRYRWQKGVAYSAFILSFFLVARVWFDGMGSIATFFGLLTAGLAIALQDLIKGLAGWIFLLWRRPFWVGDRIQIGKHIGDVIDVRIFMFTLLEIGNWVDADQSTGRIIHVPNGRVFSDPTANYTKGFQFIWDEIAVLITFESNWQKAKSILSEISLRHSAHLTKEAEDKVREASKQFMIFYTNLTPTVYTSVKDSGILLTIRYLINPRQRRISEQAIWEDILLAFAQRTDIDFAYPTQRFFNNAEEGKPGFLS